VVNPMEHIDIIKRDETTRQKLSPDEEAQSRAEAERIARTDYSLNAVFGGFQELIERWRQKAAARRPKR
jgi:hypothetical protein